MVKIDEAGKSEREKDNMEEPAPEAMCKINKAEVPGNRKVVRKDSHMRHCLR
jgi:hypothetical protein